MAFDDPATANTDNERRLPEEIVAAIRAAPRPVVNTRYLASTFDVPVDEMTTELESLAAAGLLVAIEVGGRPRLWELALETELGTAELGTERDE